MVSKHAIRGANSSKEKSKPTRQRAQLSCDLCRRYKRKCDRCSPCGECRFRSKACSFQTKQICSSGPMQSQKSMLTPSPKQHNTSTIFSTIPRLDSFLSTSDQNQVPNAEQSVWINSDHSSNTSTHLSESTPQTEVEPHWKATRSFSSADRTALLEEMVCLPNVLQHILSSWAREDDWYHEIINDSPFTIAIANEPVDMLVVRRYAGVIYGIIAIVAQVHPSELDAILLRLNNNKLRKHLDQSQPFISSEEVGRVAEQSAREWLNEAVRNSNATNWKAEVFQTSFLLTKLCKFMGRWSDYRDNLVCDIGRLHRAKLHHLSCILRDGSSAVEETKTLYRSFWHYFTLERMSSIFDGLPYTLQARNADTWLFEETGFTHIHTLCKDRGIHANDINTDKKKLPENFPSALLTCLSPCGQLMARLAAQAGQIQDRIASLSSNSSLSMQERFQHAEVIADQIGEAMIELGNRANSVHLTPSQSLLLSIGRARIRRDSAVQLSESLHLRPDGASQWDLAAHIFYRRRLDMAKLLIECAVTHAGRIPLHLLGEPFFTYFIHDPVMELATAIQKEYQTGSQGIILDDFLVAITGRNLLVIIAKQSELSINHKLAKESCDLLADVVKNLSSDHILTHDLYKYISDTKRIVNHLEVSQLETPVQRKGDSKESGLQEAADVLDWVASLPALQTIFELSPN